MACQRSRNFALLLSNTDSTHIRSPVAEVVYAVRAISPLIVALVLLVVVVLRQPLPSKGFVDFDDEDDDDGDDEEQQEDKEKQRVDSKDAASNGGAAHDPLSSTKDPNVNNNSKSKNSTNKQGGVAFSISQGDDDSAKGGRRFLGKSKDVGDVEQGLDQVR